MNPREVLPEEPIDPTRCDCGAVVAGLSTHYKWCECLQEESPGNSCDEDDTKELDQWLGMDIIYPGDYYSTFGLDQWSRERDWNGGR